MGIAVIMVLLGFALYLLRPKMSSWQAAVFALLAAAAVGALEFWWNKRKAARPVLPEQRLEAKLAKLEALGIKLAPRVTVDSLLRESDRSYYERRGWDTILPVLGVEIGRKQRRTRCEILWYFDTECIEGDGSYVYIVERMVGMAQGSLPITDVEDHVDHVAEDIWVVYKLNGEPTKLRCKFRDDWVDMNVIHEIARQLQQTDPSKTFAIYDLAGQDMVIGCFAKDQLKQLRRARIGFRAIP